MAISPKIPPEIWGIVAAHLLTPSNLTIENYNNFKRALTGVNSTRWSAVLEYVDETFTAHFGTIYRTNIKMIYDANKTSSILPHLYTLSDSDLIDIFSYPYIDSSENYDYFRNCDTESNSIDLDYVIISPNHIVIPLIFGDECVCIDEGDYIYIILCTFYLGWRLNKCIQLYKNGIIKEIFDKSCSDFDIKYYDCYNRHYYNRHFFYE